MVFFFILAASFHLQLSFLPFPSRNAAGGPALPNCPRGPRRACRERSLAHSITSSARASTIGGTVRPSAFAVLRLITRSYLVGACTGRLLGLSPLRMR